MKDKLYYFVRRATATVLAVLVLTLIYSSCAEEEVVPSSAAIEESAGATPTAGNTYYIQSRRSDYYLEVENASNSDGAYIVQETYSGADEQRWEVVSVSGSVYRIRNEQSLKTLSIEGGSTINRALLIQESYDGSDYMEMTFANPTADYWMMQMEHTDKSLDCTGSNPSQGANIWQWTDNTGNINQHWTFTQVGGSNPGTDNLALGKDTEQTSTTYNGSSDRAVDGDTAGNWGGGSVTHTGAGVGQYWQVDLGATYSIGDIDIYNRTDNCCMHRLNDITVSVLNSSENEQWSDDITSSSASSLSTNAGGTSGRYIRITQNQNQALSLAEVEVYSSDGSDGSGDGSGDGSNGDYTSIPALIQAEDFDNQSGTQTENTTDSGGGTNVGYIDSGDFLEYNIDVPSSGDYMIDFRVASRVNGTSFAIYQDNSQVGSVSSSATGAWQSWETVTEVVSLSSGNHTLRLQATGSGWNINWMDINAYDGGTNYDAPGDIPKFQDALGDSRLQEPTSSPLAATSAELLAGYTSDEFKVVNGDEISFYQTGASNRTELRFEDNYYVNNGNRAVHANLSIISQEGEQSTFIQIHDDANAGSGPNKPLLRMYRRESDNHIYAAIKTDASGDNTDHFDCGTTPSGYFDCDVTLNNGTMTISINGTTEVSEDVSFWTFPSYWKAGVYNQNSGGTTIYFNELTW